MAQLKRLPELNTKRMESAEFLKREQGQLEGVRP
jgi:dTDP-4-amino-4,6-dideoxygalactose transaminase